MCFAADPRARVISTEGEGGLSPALAFSSMLYLLVIWRNHGYFGVYLALFIPFCINRDKCFSSINVHVEEVYLRTPYIILLHMYIPVSLELMFILQQAIAGFILPLLSE